MKLLQDLVQELGGVWEAQHEVLCRGLNWERFTSVEHAQVLANCEDIKCGHLLHRESVYFKNNFVNVHFVYS